MGFIAESGFYRLMEDLIVDSCTGKVLNQARHERSWEAE